MTLSCCANIYELPLAQILLGEHFHPGGAASTRALASACLINRRSLVLDIAAASGNSAQLLAQEYGARVIAQDISFLNLQKGQSRQVGSQNQRVHHLNGDAHTLPLADNSVDVVLCECALCTFDDGSKALAEAFRVLKPGGFIGLSDLFLNRPLPTSLNNELSRWLCIRDAHPWHKIEPLLADTGFVAIRMQDKSSDLLNMVTGIVKKAEALILPGAPFADQKTNKQPLNESSPEQLFPDQLFPDRKELLQTLSGAKDYILSQGAGYFMLNARKPLATNI
ncbi:MAG: hypothetical protein COA42_10295 [Alteromonadaceae bacterium]|nr:MAG: hypothetical protein COA42_10295 [Alteromonadaceae bacterium]